MFRPDHATRSRRGAVLVQFALLTAALLGIAALVTDIGLVRDARTAMQRSVDAAALEGVRWADHATDAVRRERAAALVRGSFDADGVTDTAGDYELVDDRIGAGPTLAYARLGGVYAAGGLDTASIGVHKPRPELNLSNLAFGDLVAGDVRDEALGNGGQPFVVGAEDSSYARNDFEPASAGSVASARSFLARLRRTPDLDGLDAVPGASSNGGGVPLIFGHGPLTLASEDSGYDVRELGIATRATAIATARPVVAAAPFLPELATLLAGAWERTAFGLAVVDATVAGSTIELAAIPALVANDPTNLVAGAVGAWDLAPDGTLTPDGAPGGLDLELVLTPRARYLAFGDTPAPVDGLVRIGDELLAAATDAVTSTTLSLDSPLDPADPGGSSVRHTLLVPVLDPATRRVVGFLGADLFVGPKGEEADLRDDLDGDPAQIAAVLARTPTSIRVELLAPRVVPVNARADDGVAWARLRDEPALADAFDALTVRALAPVLVR